jgi:hypothetical protein
LLHCVVEKQIEFPAFFIARTRCTTSALIKDGSSSHRQARITDKDGRQFLLQACHDGLRSGAMLSCDPAAVTFGLLTALLLDLFEAISRAPTFHNLISGVDGQEGNNLGGAMLQGLLGGVGPGLTTGLQRGALRGSGVPAVPPGITARGNG